MYSFKYVLSTSYDKLKTCEFSTQGVLTLYNVCSAPWRVSSVPWGNLQHHGGVQYSLDYHEYRGDILSSVGYTRDRGGIS